MHFGSKAFVFIVFSVLAVSFWSTTGLLYWEFASNWRQPEFEGSLWFSLLTHYSHLFLFFPLFGTVALFAFFLPAAVFVDMYWRKASNTRDEIPYARQRFVGGFIGVAGLSMLIALGLGEGDEVGLWQLSAEQIRKDGTTRGNCIVRGQDGKCLRISFATALDNVRRVSQDREQVVDLRRNCKWDSLVERVKASERRRFCFVTARYSPRPEELQSQLLNDEACCKALSRFETDVRNTYQASSANRSWVDRLQVAALPLNVFFLLVLLVISILLAARRRRIESQYAEFARRIDRGVIVGTFAMLLLPFMNHSYLLSTELLYGPNQPLMDATGVSFYRVPYALSIAFAIWGFFILLFFVHREDKDAERASKIMGFIASGIFVLKYETIVNFAVRFAGSGAGYQSVSALICLASVMLLALVYMRAFWRSDNRKADPGKPHA